MVRKPMSRASKRAVPCGGTDGSNPAPSSGESGANRDRGDQRSPSTRGPASCRQHYGRRPEAEPELEFHLPPVPARFLDHNAQLLAIPKTVVSAVGRDHSAPTKCVQSLLHVSTPTF